MIFLVEYQAEDVEGNTYKVFNTIEHNRCNLCTEQVIHEEFIKWFGKPDKDDRYHEGNRTLTIKKWTQITVDQRTFLNSIGIN